MCKCTHVAVVGVYNLRSNHARALGAQEVPSTGIGLAKVRVQSAIQYDSDGSSIYKNENKNVGFKKSTKGAVTRSYSRSGGF